MGCRVLIHAKPITRQSWDFCSKDGFYIGLALNSYCCFKLVKSNTKSQIISDTVEFCHAYRSIPAPTPGNKIIHGLQVTSGALTNAPSPTSISQLKAIANLRDLFESWRLLGPPSSGQGRILSPGRPGVSIQEPLRVPSPSSSTVVPPPWTALMPSPCLVSLTPAPLPVHSPIQVTPRHITFNDTPPPRVATSPSPPRLVIEPTPPHGLPHMSPIAHRTRACAKAPLALFTSSRPCRYGISYHIPMAKPSRVPEEPLGFAGLCQAFSMSPKEANGFAYLCAALEKVDRPSALSILDPTTGNFLEHCQLCRDPHYKPKWDTSYANELGRLCQGIGSVPTPNSQRIAGTDTFCLIN